jgi:inhibitor of cysteine peptidase
MKKALVFGLISILLIPLLIAGCKKEEAPAPEMPALNGGQEAKMIELTTDDFMAQNHIVKDIELIRPGSLVVSLGANPTTGFQWGETAEVSEPSVVKQVDHNYVEPQASGEEPVVGAPGKDVWVFDSQNAGAATIKMSYGRPWEGGEKDAWTLTINVTVK